MYVKEPGEEFEKINFELVNYPFGMFNGIFPPITDQMTNRGLSFQIIPESSYNGKLNYNLVHGLRFKFELGQDILKFRVFIKDRALNNSNVIETPEILFE